MSAKNIKPPHCPKCDSNKVIPILYGDPTCEAMAAADRNELVLGGCIVGNGIPIWYCPGCGHNFGELKFDNDQKGDDLDLILEQL